MQQALGSVAGTTGACCRRSRRRRGAGVGARGAGRGRAGRWAWARGALGVGARGARRGRPGRAAWACGAAWARDLATGCALGALGLFSIRFDSVLFLSRFLDIVREPGS